MTPPDADHPLPASASKTLAGLEFDEPLLDFTGHAAQPMKDTPTDIPSVIAAPGDDEMVLAQVFTEKPEDERP